MLGLQVVNCFLLIIPVLLWNALFSSKLPEGYFSDARVPRVIVNLEKTLRLLVLGFPILLPLQVEHSYGKAGLAIYVVGVVSYGASWVMQMYNRETRWSQSAIGILAPAYTPLIWMAGIALIGRSGVYALLAVVFTFIHTWHKVMVFRFS
ncbi:MAG: hypothetical protein JSW37_02300 [Anaerolineales bacterium]|nr:MAG: hypothetical protein JSW37_02300 [Anaerolineales bacterium]